MGFEKGNPGGGRPRKTEQQKAFEAKCRDWSALYAFDRLKGWSDSENPKVATWALGELLNRGFGKPVETSVVEAYVTPEAGSTISELAAGIAELIGSPASGSGRMVGEIGMESGK